MVRGVKWKRAWKPRLRSCSPTNNAGRAQLPIIPRSAVPSGNAVREPKQHNGTGPAKRSTGNFNGRGQSFSVTACYPSNRNTVTSPVTFSRPRGTRARPAPRRRFVITSIWGIIERKKNRLIDPEERTGDFLLDPSSSSGSWLGCSRLKNYFPWNVPRV